MSPHIPPAILLSQVQYWVWTSNHCKCRLSSIVSQVSRLYAFDTQIKLIQISLESFQSIWSLSQLQDLTPFRELRCSIFFSLLIALKHQHPASEDHYRPDC